MDQIHASQASPQTLTFKAFRACFLILTVLLPFSLLRGMHFWVLFIGVFVMTTAFIFFWLRHHSGPFADCRRTEMDAWIGAYLAIFLAASFLADVPYAALQQFYRIGAMIVLFLTGLYICEHRPQVKLYVQTLSFLGAGISLLSLLQYSSLWIKNLLPIGAFNSFLGFYEMALPVCLAYALAQREHSKRTFFIFLFFLMMVGFSSLRSLFAVSATAAGILVTLQLLSRRGVIKVSTNLFALFAAMVSILLALSFFIEMQKNDVISMLSRSGSELSLFAKGFWFGGGPGVSDVTSSDYSRLWLSGGLSLFLMTAALFLSAARESWIVAMTQSSKLKASVGAGYLGGLIALALHGTVYSNLHTTAHALLFAALTGVVFSLGTKRVYKTERISRIGRRVIFGMCVLMLGITVWLGTANYFRWAGRVEVEKGDTLNGIYLLGKSVQVNPFNAETYYWLGVAKDKAGMADRAQSDFKMAAKLNPYSPRYMWLEGDVLDPVSATSRDYFTSAEQIVRSDARHNPALERRLEELLRACLQSDDSYGEKVSQLLWDHYGSTARIEKFFTESSAGLTGFVRFIESKELWRLHRRYLLLSQGMSPERMETRAGAYRWTEPETLALTQKLSTGDPIKIPVELKDKIVKITFYARGSMAAGVYPQLVLKVDDIPQDSFSINNRKTKAFETVLSVPAGTHVLSFQFLNDYFNPFIGEDRNIWIEKITLSYPMD